DGVAGTGDFGEGNGIVDRRQEIIDRDFVRKILQGSVEIIGPKISRIFERPGSSFSPTYKHTIELRVFYLYQSKVDNPGDVIPFDEKDSIAGNQNSLEYSLTTRLFAKRPGVTPRPEEPSRGLSLPGNLAGSVGEGQSLPAPPEPGKEEKTPLSPVEIASFQIAQTYSLLGPLSTRGACFFDVNGKLRGPDCVISNLSPLLAAFRFNPTLYTSVDLKATYDILFNAFRGGSLSANFRSPERGFVDLTWFFQNTLQGSAVDSSQVGLLAETSVLNRKLILGFQGNYDITGRELRDQRYKLGYNTQCCGFTLEVLDRSFQGISQQEFRFLVNLKGIGNVLDLNSGTAAIPTVPINF
ncbi:MAG TPA: LPS assembly protein LptD, partial [Candidatus Polarisedimenticolia bacterium]|nr:LPS assembly protein LptD [Candidatus Polarisedimenticolia bacterium]